MQVLKFISGVVHSDSMLVCTFEWTIVLYSPIVVIPGVSFNKQDFYLTQEIRILPSVEASVDINFLGYIPIQIFSVAPKCACPLTILRINSTIQSAG